MRYLIFGSHGDVGSAIYLQLGKNTDVVRGAREYLDLRNLSGQFDGVIWAQGLNVNDSVLDFDEVMANELMNVNVNFITKTASILIQENKVKSECNFVIISSIWSKLSRKNKLSYSITKAAILGLIKSMAIDLAPLGISVNAIAPGVIDTEMTRKNLSKPEIDRIISETPAQRLVTLEEISTIVEALVSGQLSGITGQEFIVDGGWTVSKLG